MNGDTVSAKLLAVLSESKNIRDIATTGITKGGDFVNVDAEKGHIVELCANFIKIMWPWQNNILDLNATKRALLCINN
jgi:hypothetical protein